MMVIFLCLLLFVHLQPSHSAQIPCVTFTKPFSGYGYTYGPTNVTCADGGYPNYTAIDCECGSAWRTCNGSTIVNDTCYTYPYYEDGRNRASINCCDLSSPFGNTAGDINDLQTTCTSRFSSISSSTGGSTAEVSCNSDETLLGCMGLTPGGRTQGSCIGSGCADNLTTIPPTSGVFNTSDDTCVAVKGGTGTQGIIAQATCCKFGNNDISITCETKWSDLSGTNDDALTYVSCGDSTGDVGDYFMTNCGAVRPDSGSNHYDGSYFRNEDGGYGGILNNDSDTTATCVGWNGGGNVYGIYAQALCCKYTTSSPTNAPTNIPSQPPTNIPSQPPTRVPTMQPSNAPTILPTIAPSNSPSTPPTNFPTNNPTNIPTDEPSGSPSDKPTISPTTRDPTSTPSLVESQELVHLVCNKYPCTKKKNTFVC